MRDLMLNGVYVLGAIVAVLMAMGMLLGLACTLIGLRYREEERDDTDTDPDSLGDLTYGDWSNPPRLDGAPLFEGPRSTARRVAVTPSAAPRVADIRPFRGDQISARQRLNGISQR